MRGDYGRCGHQRIVEGVLSRCRKRFGFKERPLSLCIQAKRYLDDKSCAFAAIPVMLTFTISLVLFALSALYPGIDLFVGVLELRGSL